MFRGDRTIDAPGAESTNGVPLAARDVVGVAPDGLVEVATAEGPRRARLAIVGPYNPRPGDRVLVGSGEDGELYVVGVLRALRPAELLAEAPDGTTVSRRLDNAGRSSLVVCAPDGRVIVEHRESEGRTLVYGADAGIEVTAGDGPLTLTSESEVRIDGRRGVRVRSERRVELETGTADDATRLSLDVEGAMLRGAEVEVDAQVLRLSASRVLRFTAEALETTAMRIRERADTAELDVGQLVERAREAYREVEELAQTRAGEIRFVAKEALRALAKHAHLKAREDIKLRAEKNIYLD